MRDGQFGTPGRKRVLFLVAEDPIVAAQRRGRRLREAVENCSGE